MGRLLAVVSGYRPIINRLIYGLALLGVLDTVHLAIQQARGFEQGCFGAAAPDLLAGISDCGAVIGSQAGTVMGVSNTVWGMIFYALVAILSILLVFLPVQWRRSCRLLRGGLIAFAFFYSGYLVYYQFAELEQLCILCMISAGLVTALLSLAAFELLTAAPYLSERSWTPPTVKRELAYLGAITLFIGLLLAAEVSYLALNEPGDPWQEEFEKYDFESSG